MTFGNTDEIIQVRMEEGLAYAVKYQDLRCGEGWHQGFEDVMGHVGIGEYILTGVFQAHGALQVASGRCLNDELCGMRLQGRRYFLLYFHSSMVLIISRPA